MTTDFKSIPFALSSNNKGNLLKNVICSYGALNTFIAFSSAVLTCKEGAVTVADVGPLLGKCDDPKMAEDAGVLQVVSQLDKACKEAGFFYVKGHGIPESMLKGVRDVARKFFDLPYEEKLKIKMSSKTGFRGYQRIGENITKGVPDMHEAVDSYKVIEPGAYGELGRVMEGQNLWPAYPANFNSLMEEYIIAVKELSRKILRGIALALGGSPYAFEGERAGDTFWVMRVIGYPGCTNAGFHKTQNENIGCGAHTDYGLLTLVNQDDDIAALQVRNRSGEWIWAVPIPETFVCNIGDMLKIYSNGLYETTLHRPNFDTVVEPLDFCVEKTGGVAELGHSIYGEHLIRKVLTNFATDE